ncbi:unnamed protein product [Lactuca saligna]|uniref:Uncharacterized protein n=1 Tax=Lactuca saligna TaxID=75948 RepID=A0AA35ZKH9_LACSI|nr:unnamed protein product [Lactuca saligna]
MMVGPSEPVPSPKKAAKRKPKVLEPVNTNPEVTFEILNPFSNYHYFNIHFYCPIPTCFLGISQSQTPLFTNSNATTTTSNIEPLVTINASDAGERASDFAAGHSTPPASPFRQNDPYMIYGDDDEDFAGLTYSPFNIRTESDDEAPVMGRKLKAIHKRLDLLLQASKASSNDDYSQATIKSLLETLTKEHSTNLEKMNKAVDASTSVCNNMTEKANEVISSLGSTLKREKAKLQEVRTGLPTDHVEFNSSISSKISKLQDDSAMERKIMDSLSLKIEKVKVLTVKLRNAEKQVIDLLSEKATMKSCIADVNGMTIRCSRIWFYSKRRGEGVTQSKKEDPKLLVKATVNPEGETEPKGKEKLFIEVPIIDNSEDEEPDENELKKKECDAQIYEHQRIIREAQVKEKS